MLQGDELQWPCELLIWLCIEARITRSRGMESQQINLCYLQPLPGQGVDTARDRAAYAFGPKHCKSVLVLLENQQLVERYPIRKIHGHFWFD